jgi:hypothetical protein
VGELSEALRQIADWQATILCEEQSCTVSRGFQQIARAALASMFPAAQPQGEPPAIAYTGQTGNLYASPASPPPTREPMYEVCGTCGKAKGRSACPDCLDCELWWKENPQPVREPTREREGCAHRYELGGTWTGTEWADICVKCGGRGSK